MFFQGSEYTSEMPLPPAIWWKIDIVYCQFDNIIPSAFNRVCASSSLISIRVVQWSNNPTTFSKFSTACYRVTTGIIQVNQKIKGNWEWLTSYGFIHFYNMTDFISSWVHYQIISLFQIQTCYNLELVTESRCTVNWVTTGKCY